jgi:purine catabolism regulator
VAEELGVHRNTVRNRVAEIERAVGGSLDDAQVRADAWIALQARELTSAGAPPG